MDVRNASPLKGAIGSEYKIDASYLSPNVSVTAKLEATSPDQSGKDIKD